jgi:hypothetical protein
MNNSNIYAGYRYPAQIIILPGLPSIHADFGDLEELFAASSFTVCYETIH